MTDVVTHAEVETFDAGRALGRDLRAGDVLLVSDPLGAGKTAFIRGVAAGLGCDPAQVSSPTFTLVQEYHGRVRLYHADLYRLTPAETADLDLDEATSDGVLAVEWPDRWRSAPETARYVAIADEGETRRRIRIE